MKKDFFINNRKKLAEKIGDNSIVIMFAGRAPYKSADSTYKFVPNRNFYYMTGIDEENIILMMSKINGVFSERLYIEEIDEVEAKWTGRTITKEEAEEKSGIAAIEYKNKFKPFLSQILSYYSIDNLYLDLERQEYGIPFTDAQNFAKSMKDRYPYLEIKNIYKEISLLRTIKSDKEIEHIREAIAITDEGIKSMMQHAHDGMNEYELEAYFNFELNKRGIRNLAFDSIVAGGQNATVLHYNDNNNVIKSNELVLLDLGAQYKYYNADISRTFPVNGKFTEKQRLVYNIVLSANKAVIEAAKPGVTLRELQEITKKVLADGCKSIGLIKEDNELGKYYFHGVSHFLGLDDHDVGPAGIKLEPGMVITDEPGLYIEEEGIGIRIEDDLLITEDGCVNLSEQIIKEILDIEDFISKNR